MNRFYKVMFVLALASLVSAASLQAASIKWIGTVSSDWNNPANWDTGYVPGFLSYPTVYINTVPGGGTPTPVISTNDGTINQLEVGRTDAGAGTSGPGYLEITAGGKLSVNGEIIDGVFGTPALGTSTIALDGGTTAGTGGILSKVGGGNFHVGWQGGNGQLLMSGGAVYNQINGNTVYVGSSGKGSQGLISMTGNSTANLIADMRFGDNEASMFNAGGCSGTLAMSGNATINRDGGSYVIFGQGNLAAGSGASGTFTMEGNSKFLTSTHSFVTIIAHDYGTGSMSLKDNAVYQGGEMIVGQNVGSEGTVTLGGNSNTKLLTSSGWGWYGWEGTLDIGRWGGTGHMTVTDNAVLDIGGRTLIGNNSNGVGGTISHGDLTLSGNAVMLTHQGTMRNQTSLWTDGGDVYVGANEYESAGVKTYTGGVGTLTVKDNALMIVRGALQVGIHGGQGTYTQSGGSVITGDFFLANDQGSTGNAIINGGSYTTRGWLSIGAGSTAGVTSAVSKGSMTVNGGNVMIYGRNYVGRQGAQGTFNLNGGNVTSMDWMNIAENNDNTIPTNYGEVNLNGGVYSTPGIFIGWNGGTGVNCNAVINLNGGILRVTNKQGHTDADANEDNFINPNGSTASVNLKSGGGLIDTNGFNIKIPMPFAGVGGLTKLGYGSLGLGVAETYTGNTVVAGGLLVLNNGVSFANPTINVLSGAAIGGNNANIANAPTLNLSAGAKVIATPTAIGTWSYLASTANLSTGDTIVSNVSVATGAYPNVGQVDLGVINVASGTKIGLEIKGANGSLLPFSGDSSVLNYQFDIAHFTSATGANFVPAYDDYLDKDPVVTTTSNLASVTLVDPGARGYTGGATWTTSTWAEGSIPTTSSQRAWFTTGGNTVQLDENVTLSSLLFNGDGNHITKKVGSSITLQSSIAMNAQIQSLFGASTIDPDIALAAGAPKISVMPGARLTLNGVVSNLTSTPVGINFDGMGAGSSETPTFGTLALNGANTFTGPVIMTGYGRLEVNALGNVNVPNPLGMSSADPANFVLNGFLAYTGTTDASTDRGITLASQQGLLIGIEVPGSTTVTLNGQIKAGAVSAFRKTGTGTLVFANAGSNAVTDGDFRITSGNVVFKNGTYNKIRNNIDFQNGSGDFYIGDTANQPVALTIQNGATVNSGNTQLYLAGGAGTSATLTIGANSSDTATFKLGYAQIGYTGGNAHIIMNGNSVYESVDAINIAPIGGTATVELHDNAQMRTTNWFGVGRDQADSNGTFLMDGNSSLLVDEWANVGHVGKGLVTIAGNAKATFQDLDLGVNPGSNGTVNLQGNSVTFVNNSFYAGWTGGEGHVVVKDNAKLTVGYHIVVGSDQVNGVTTPCDFTVQDNATVIQTNADGRFRANIYVSNSGGIGTWNQNGGTTITNNWVILGDANVSANLGGSGTLNLNGGTFTCPQIQVGWDNTRSIATTIGTINFNGGTLAANANNDNYIQNLGTGVLTLNLKAGGAVIDTSLFTVGIQQPLTDAAATGGGVKKLGSGLLRLLAQDSYTGNTVVAAGSLQTFDGVGLPSTSSLELQSGTNYLGLDNGSDQHLTRSNIKLGADVGFSSGGQGSPTLYVNLGNDAHTLTMGDASSTTTDIKGRLRIGTDRWGCGAVVFENGLDLNGGTRNIQEDMPAVSFQWGGWNSQGILSGVISDSKQSGAGLVKTGIGLLRLDAANTFTGATTVKEGSVWLHSATAPALQGNVVMTATPTSPDPRGTWLLTNYDNQFGPNSHINFVGTGSSNNAAMVLLGTKQTVAGLNCTTGNAVIEAADTVWRPLQQKDVAAVLTVYTAAGDNSFFNGYLTDKDFSYYPKDPWGNPQPDSGNSTLALTKDGPGTLTLDGCNVINRYNYAPATVLHTANDYTGPTTILAGELALNAGGQVSPTVVNSALFTINAGDHTVTAISGTGTTEVLSGSLTALSIEQGTLQIGGTHVASANAVVPEPSTIIMLVLAGMGALLAWRRK